jgi:hypothetical protein
MQMIKLFHFIQGSSLAAPNYTLVVTLVSMFVSVALALFPLVKYRNHLIPVRNFFLRPRTALIFTCLLTLGWFAAMISMTAHANNEENCTLNSRLQKNDRSYANSWMKQVIFLIIDFVNIELIVLKKKIV